jgi:hypothetical protein
MTQPTEAREPPTRLTILSNVCPGLALGLAQGGGPGLGDEAMRLSSGRHDNCAMRSPFGAEYHAAVRSPRVRAGLRPSGMILLRPVHNTPDRSATAATMRVCALVVQSEAPARSRHEESQRQSAQ